MPALAAAYGLGRYPVGARGPLQQGHELLDGPVVSGLGVRSVGMFIVDPPPSHLTRVTLLDVTDTIRQPGMARAAARASPRPPMARRSRSMQRPRVGPIHPRRTPRVSAISS